MPSPSPGPPGPRPPPPPPPPRPFPPTPPYRFQDPTLGWDARLADLLGVLTLEEKVSVLQTHSPAIDRLAIRGYSFETECDSGVCGGSGGNIFCEELEIAVHPEPASL